MPCSSADRRAKSRASARTLFRPISPENGTAESTKVDASAHRRRRRLLLALARREFNGAITKAIKPACARPRARGTECGKASRGRQWKRETRPSEYVRAHKVCARVFHGRGQENAEPLLAAFSRLIYAASHVCVRAGMREGEV